MTDHTAPELFALFDQIRVWQRGARRAPHKPLLVLLALGRLWRGLPPVVEFSEIETELRKLLERFGPSGASASRHYPFWHLRSDGLWVLHASAAILARPPGATPTLSELRNEHVSGGFAPAVLDTLQRNRTLIPLIAQRIVDAHFPESLQNDVLAAVGLDTEEAMPGSRPDQRQRDPSFRPKVLLAYEYRCCVCGHDLRLDGQVIGLEAAHIQWFQAQGPDIEPNGLALCSLHHKLFDLGVFTVAPDSYIVTVSQHVTGSEQVRDRLLSYHGAPLILPQSKAYLPQTIYLDWHKKQVFKAPSRDI